MCLVPKGAALAQLILSGRPSSALSWDDCTGQHGMVDGRHGIIIVILFALNASADRQAAYLATTLLNALTVMGIFWRMAVHGHATYTSDHLASLCFVYLGIPLFASAFKNLRRAYSFRQKGSHKALGEATAAKCLAANDESTTAVQRSGSGTGLLVHGKSGNDPADEPTSMPLLELCQLQATNTGVNGWSVGTGSDYFSSAGIRRTEAPVDEVVSDNNLRVPPRAMPPVYQSRTKHLRALVKVGNTKREGTLTYTILQIFFLTPHDQPSSETIKYM